MSFDITVQHDLKKLQRDLSVLERKALPQATVRTLNRVAESARVASGKHIAKQMGSRQAGVKRRIKVQKASFKRLWATLTAHGKSLPLIEFVVGSKKATQQPGGKRGRVKAKLFGKTRTYQNAFIAPRKAGKSKTTVYERKGKKRLPVFMRFSLLLLPALFHHQMHAIRISRPNQPTPMAHRHALGRRRPSHLRRHHQLLFRPTRHEQGAEGQ